MVVVVEKAHERPDGRERNRPTTEESEREGGREGQHRCEPAITPDRRHDAAALQSKYMRGTAGRGSQQERDRGVS